MNETRNKDLELWKAWHTSRSMYDLEKLMKQFDPLLKKETIRWSSSVTPALLEAEAKKLALKAFETYDPKRDVLLSTHVVTWLQKLSRFAYQRQSSLNVPEQHRLNYNKYIKAKKTLENDLNREPTHEELSDHLGLPPKKLTELIELVNKKELLESGEGPSLQLSKEDQDIIHLVYYDLTPRQQKIFEYRTGYNGKPILSATEIQKALNLTQGQLSYELSKITEVVNKANRFR